MSASQSHSKTADKTAQQTAGTVKEIEINVAKAWLNGGAITITERGNENFYFRNEFGHEFFCKCSASDLGIRTITAEEYRKTCTRRYPYDVTINDRHFLRITGDFRFEIHADCSDGKGLELFGDYVVDDTRVLEPIIAVLEREGWTEDELNAAIEPLNRTI